jgi:hypothetical protein
MPEHHVQDLEVRAVKLEHGQASQARKCAHYESGGHRIHSKAAP